MVLSVDGELLLPSLILHMPFSPFHTPSFHMCCGHANRTLSLGRHFNGEESFDTGPMAPASEQPAVANMLTLEGSKSGTKL